MGWRGYVDTERKTVFFWSQKAGCTTLFALLADNITPRPAAKSYFHRNSRFYPACLPAIRREGYRSVILVRNPVQRIISAYFNKFCLYRNKPLRCRDDLESFSRDLHDRYCDLNGITGAARQDNSMNFEDFLATVADLHASRGSLRTPVNGHWDTQCPPQLARSRWFSYDHVLHLESLDSELPPLLERLGMVYRPRVANRTRVAKEPEPGYFGALPGAEVAEHSFGYDNFITPETLARIEALYAVDFEGFGYPRSSPPKETEKGLFGKWQGRLAGR